MAGVVRLVTLVDADDDSHDSRQISVTACHEAVLDDDDRVLLLDDRGWSESGPPDIWVETSVSDIVETARTVVGPDEPFGVRSHQDMAAEHWGQLAAVLRRNGVVLWMRETCLGCRTTSCSASDCSCASVRVQAMSSRGDRATRSAMGT